MRSYSNRLCGRYGGVSGILSLGALRIDHECLLTTSTFAKVSCARITDHQYILNIGVAYLLN